MSFALADLLAGAVGKRPPDLAVEGINADSRAIAPGEAFFALPGTRVHGNAFAAEAAARGAVAVISDRQPDVDPGVPVVLVDDVRAVYARAAARRFAPQPEIAVAVTGTNGKSSIVSFVRQIWAACGIAGASLGTVGVETAAGLVPRELTTSDALALHRDLRDLKLQGIDHVALEASSQGLDQRRVDGLRFRAVGYTNLTQDHLEYHGGFEPYREAKLRLFRELLADDGAAVVNSDDPEHMPFLFAALDRGVTLLTVGREGAYFEVTDISNEGFGQRVRGRLVGEEVSFHLPLTGAFQVSNALVALGLATNAGADKDRAVAALETLKGAKGRLELVGRRGDGAIFVDYAHSPDALKNALQSLRPYARGKLVVVFGCGGDRDKAKRPVMGAIAHELADRVIVTDDNPRTEEPAAIRSQIIAAARGAEEIGDRRGAIAAAVAALGPQDVLLIAGKGHEDYQIVGTSRHHFSDHEVVAETLREL
ncbi:UDP-N-acetylmuramoyl-L-alanyl-D-glutamate--2,6-diaminopimelate ligase [Devosia sp.]|uniref:UDP-N-acetylmuramoyl-L-alanyl-D-glutamate--2, 6-diaminopimelate ligase n=1 Tax=Devosia sp. TaxID=1871048 RepID=UPI002EF07C02